MAERFRVSAQEIKKIERLPKQHRRAALYRKIILNISKDPAYKLRPRTREVAKMIGIPYFRACSYIATSGAWSGQPWIVGGSKEEKTFERDMTRPAKGTVADQRPLNVSRRAAEENDVIFQEE